MASKTFAFYRIFNSFTRKIYRAKKIPRILIPSGATFLTYKYTAPFFPLKTAYSEELIPKHEHTQFVWPYSGKIYLRKFFKTFLGTFLLAPIRIFVGIHLLFLISMTCFIADPFHFNSWNQSRMDFWKRDHLESVKILTRLLLFTFGFYQIKINNIENRDESVKLIVSNRVSFIDPLFFVATNGPSFLTSDFVKYIPFVSTIASFLGSIAIDTECEKSIENAKIEISERTLSNRDNVQPLVIFPEESTYNGINLFPFKEDAFDDGMPVQPVVLKHANKQSLLKENNNFEFFLNVLTNINNSIEFTYLPVYKPNKIERLFPAIYAFNLRKEMSKELHRIQS